MIERKLKCRIMCITYDNETNEKTRRIVVGTYGIADACHHLQNILADKTFYGQQKEDNKYIILTNPDGGKHVERQEYYMPIINDNGDNTGEYAVLEPTVETLLGFPYF